MCGIVGYIGSKKALPILINGLKRLEYRGYDSAGIAYLDNKDIKVIKSIGRISRLEERIDYNTTSTIGIGHTRWATHGKVNDTNCHPHQVNNITLVHNGIIENYLEIKEELIKEGYTFKGDTDSEVACSYIDYLYSKSTNKDIIQVLTNASNKFIGSYALVIMIKGIKDKIFTMKKESPLVIGIGNNEYFIASDTSAYIDDTNKYIILNDKEIGIISNNSINIYKNKKEINYEIKTFNRNNIDIKLGKNKHYMLKEIKEQSNLVNKWNNTYIKNKEALTNLDISKFKKIHIIGCGTAYHAGLVAKYLFEENTNIEVSVFVASEYRYSKTHFNKDTLVIAISQSGETADTLACIKLAYENNITTLGIINVYNSSIARICDYVIYTNASIEVSVASTKAYTSQIYVLSLLVNNILKKDTKDYLELPSKIDNLINKDYSKIVDNLYNKKDIFYLGRNIDYASSLEGSLKLKEISYIHSEAFPAGELKHGPISLIEENTPVIAIITNKKIALKTISNIKEVKARGANVTLIITKDLIPNLDKNCYDNIIYLPKSNNLTIPILSIIPLQLIAYYTALKKGLDIDKPRNLAKSVTVE